MEGIQGRSVLVTGGGRGLGAAICETLAESGAQVFVADFDRALGLQCAEHLQGRSWKAQAVALDVREEGQVEEALAAVQERCGRVDAVINNAAVDVTLPMDELSIADWDRIMATNLRGPFLVARAAVGYMRAQGRGHIVNITSTAAKRAWPNASAYHASKWGLLGLSHALHAELRPLGIKVTAIVAGGMRTPFLLDRFPDIDIDTLQDPATVARAVRFALTLPDESVIPEIMVLPMRETSWP
jgi:NAD(P)-dependent dehydrogenase (short-subunit alcohol dehydrogenase family)